ncbi:hypothetical protein [Erythrobacter sp.]|uniref:hypothetical protein n=1 Tax=Erythrobacter sp. TaxID=1042 RepID=UPI0025E565A6|nr:hypothetical protein [Erythrobacter sp.]
MTTTTDNRSSEEIERDIRATQKDMHRTVEQIEGELTGRNMLNSLLDKADENGVDTRYLIDAARRNPLALGMIAVGGLWLVSDADARPSAMKPSLGRFGSHDSGHDQGFDSDGWHSEHRSYVEHMARCEPRPDEDDQTYRRRRDHSRASYFMIEQSPDEDESSFRKRLDDATDKLRERRHRASESAHDMGRQSRDRAKQAAGSAQDFYYDNPLISGLAAAFVGAVAGSALPATRTEENYVGGLGEQALDTAQAKAKQTGEQARHKKDEMIDKADRKMAESGEHNRQTGTSQPV